MKKILILILLMLSFISKASSNYEKLVYDFEFKSIDGDIIKLDEFKNKVIIVVNVASRCGYTPQYEDLQTIWSKYKNKGVVVIGVPTNNFPITEKTNVIGSKAHPFYKWAKNNHGLGAIPKWNFHKIVINKNGKVADTFASFTKPTSKKFITLIEKEIKN